MSVVADSPSVVRAAEAAALQHSATASSSCRASAPLAFVRQAVCPTYMHAWISGMAAAKQKAHRDFMKRFVTALILCCHPLLARAEDPRPNIILIFADDLGYADVRCYGATRHVRKKFP